MMGPIKLENFMGMMPKRDKRLLPGLHAQFAANCKLWSGAIDPLRQPLAVFIPSKSAVISMFRMDDGIGGSDFWATWPFDVDVIRGAVVDTRQRIYYTGEYEPRVATFEMMATGVDLVSGGDNYPVGFGNTGTDYPLAFYALGVPNPPTRGRVTSITGGVAADVTRAYLYTFRDAWGQESGPAPPFTFTGAPDGTWNLELPDTGFINTGGIVQAVHTSGVVTVYTDSVNFLRAGHRITMANIVGMTDLNAEFTVASAINISYRTVTRERTTNVVILELENTENLVAGQFITVSVVGGSDYNGTVTLDAVDHDAKTITYTQTGGDEVNTADTAGIVQLGLFTVALTTAQSYTSDGDWTREAPWNVTGLKKVIYRTVTGNIQTEFEYVGETGAATTTFADDLLDTDPRLGLKGNLVTEGYDVPDGLMHSITAMANGMTAGAVENEVVFAEQYKPYAWKLVNRQLMNNIVRGLAAFGEGQSLAVMTKALPSILTGVTPGTVTGDDVESVAPCISKRGIQSLGFAVVYPSDFGLMMIQPGGVADNLTKEYYTRDEWKKFANGGNFASSMLYDNRYYAFWINANGNGECLIFDPNNLSSVVTQAVQNVDGAWHDPETGTAYVIDTDQNVSQWDAHPALRMTYEWTSPQIKVPKPCNFGAGRVEGEFDIDQDESAAIVTENATRIARNAIVIGTITANPFRAILRGAMGSGVAVMTFKDDTLTDRETVEMAGTILENLVDAQNQFIQFEMHGNEQENNAIVLRHAESLIKTGSFRMPGGYKSDEYEFTLTGNVRTRLAAASETMKALERI